LGANPVSGRDFAKFTDRRDCRSPEAIERRRSQRLDYEPGGYTWAKPAARPPVVALEQNVASNGFVTLTRPSGKRAK
jgi:hypothetical protein